MHVLKIEMLGDRDRLLRYLDKLDRASLSDPEVEWTYTLLPEEDSIVCDCAESCGCKIPGQMNIDDAFHNGTKSTQKGKSLD